MSFIKQKILWWLLSTEILDSTKISEKEKMIIYKDVYQVEKFDILLREQVLRTIKVLALQAKDDKEIWYYRGFIAAHQQLGKQMKRSHDLWVKEKEKLN